MSTEHSLIKLRQCTLYHFGAPLTLLLCYDREKSWKRAVDGTDMGTVDASIVATHMILQIASMGLGSTWVGHFDPQKIRQAFSLPGNIIPVAILPVGYPAKSSKPHPNHNERLVLSHTVIYDH